MQLVIDVETNGFLDTLNKVHCIVAKDVETEKVYSFKPDELDKALELLRQAKKLIGHNITKFDLPALNKIFDFKYTGEVFDTLLISRLIWANRTELDCKTGNLPPKLIGRHSLESYGYRLGLLKGDFKDKENFEQWSEEMQDYCKRDCEITYRLFKLIDDANYSKEAIELEHKFSYWIKKQEDYGVCFDERASQLLYQSLLKRRLELEKNLASVFPNWERLDRIFRPKRDNKTKGYKKGVPVKIYVTEIFNPNSREHIADRLQKVLGWKPSSFTASGKVEVNEKILSELKYPEAKIISEHFTIQKRIAMLAEGEQAYLKLMRNGKIYGKVIENGAVTGRATHNNPNLSQVPSKGSAYGTEFRSLFIAPATMVMCGIDFSGIELRVLSHYLSNIDEGQFQKKLLEDDIHSANREALGLSSRSQAKTFIYAYVYNAGNYRLAQILETTEQEAKRIREKFEELIPSLKILNQQCKLKARTVGFIRGLDGRKVTCRSEHSALNTLLQSGASLLCKQATILLNENLEKNGFEFGKDYAQVLHIHDEIQFYVLKEKIEQFKTVASLIFQQVQEHFNFRCPLAGEIKVGINWSETH